MFCTDILIMYGCLGGYGMDICLPFALITKRRNSVLRFQSTQFHWRNAQVRQRTDCQCFVYNARRCDQRFPNDERSSVHISISRTQCTLRILGGFFFFLFLLLADYIFFIIIGPLTLAKQIGALTLYLSKMCLCWQIAKYEWRASEENNIV